MKNIYDLRYGNVYEADKYVRLRFSIYESLVFPFLRNGVRIPDIGCYTADLLKLLPSSVDYYRVDSDEDALVIAQKRGAKAIKLDLENKQILFDQKFDTAIATELLERLKDSEKLILQIRVLSVTV